MDFKINQVSPAVTLSRNPILSLQYLRAFAAMAVVAAHGAGVLIGQAGVDIFFVLSGFIMWVTINRNDNIVTFLKNRVIRIVPLYWIATIVMGIHRHIGVMPIVKSMLFIPYISDEGQIWPVLVQGWTLNYEMFFYLLIAIVLLLPSIRRLPAIMLIIAGLSLCGRLGSLGPIFDTYTNTLLLEFCFGVGLAELWFRKRMLRPTAIVPVALASAALAWFYQPEALPTTERFLVWGVPSALLVAAALSLEMAGLVPTVRLLLVLGNASYAIYLFHTFFLNTVIHLVNSTLPAVNLLAALAVSAAAGALITRVVEQPILIYLRSQVRLAPMR